ncbi:Xaa-Pro dipeptidase (X-Pro dipeptidase) (Prolinedipeptidase) (Prolidase) (Imidodipeptidase) [Treponema primitia ZAS-2]|uniref:Xaa-Pro dipeptidase (X-Pro dipeptidase) (Prolinedipeptidase) (Prolidase) (Imidodipeptidase) n=1 Tax=Treponema primitia (strain ATCC BAA-887 / DSM 12427 / ZAS-2) TaxID=545694 RepID=F5YMS9_TREPZ|nr:Xaa-Pro peptidase family protein [Treponema primitia]AEF86994.1 Xaa-Pro dipeptidase (X-Pro dipeptidase) (Prolinedipeptidase) (Prolidase) (Imidodipeptidase) [Treponema primitia ZAS-2]
MSTLDIYRKRWEGVRKTMQEQGISSLLLGPGSDLYYLTGFFGHISERLTCFILTHDDAFFLYPGFEKNRINPELADLAECRAHTDGDDPHGILVSFIKEKAGTAAIDNRMWAETLIKIQERLPSYRWDLASRIISPMRMCKDEEEYRCLKEAQLKAGRALGELYKWGLEGRTEKEAAVKLTEFCTREGLKKASWGPIVASGPSGESPHHSTGDRIIKKGDPVIIDFGGVYLGYQADMTRTPVIGKADGKFKEVYETVLRANQAAFQAAKPEAPCETVDAAARGVIDQAGYGEFFTHRLGHGLGLDIHEDPYMVRGNTLPIKAGMSFSDEPGIYLPGKFGVRIEDILFIGQNGAERLTEFPLTFMEL